VAEIIKTIAGARDFVRSSAAWAPFQFANYV